VLNAITAVQAAAKARLWALAALLGLCRLGGVPALLVRESGAFAGAHRAAATRVTPSKHLSTSCKYQNMTRIAAAGGNASGSHPAWDPV